MSSEHIDADGMQVITFELDDFFRAFGGIALFSGMDEEGHPMTCHSLYGEVRPLEVIGLLQTTLDQYRYNYLDRAFNILEDDLLLPPDDEIPPEDD